MQKSSKYAKLMSYPMLYHHAYGIITGSESGALFLNQLVFWCRKYNRPIYWKQEAIKNQLGLHERTQKKIRENLVAIGVLEERLKGVPAKMYYWINEEALEREVLKHEEEINKRMYFDWEKEIEPYQDDDFSETSITPKCESSLSLKCDTGIAPKCGTITKSTTKKTTKNNLIHSENKFSAHPNDQKSLFGNQEKKIEVATERQQRFVNNLRNAFKENFMEGPYKILDLHPNPITPKQLEQLVDKYQEILDIKKIVATLVSLETYAKGRKDVITIYKNPFQTANNWLAKEMAEQAQRLRNLEKVKMQNK